MIKMFVRHQVNDYGKWRKAYDDFDAERKRMGVKAAAVYPAADSDRDITVTHDFETLDKAKAFADSASLRQAMTSAGVAGKPTVWFTKSI
jgi:hypothetical protein